jgi:Cu-Zn family superoxide dismutase
MKARKGTVLASLGLVTATVIAGAVSAAGAGADWTSLGTGPDYRYPSTNGSANPFSEADATVSARAVGGTGLQVALDVSGVAAAGQRFGAHVHENPCGSTGGDAGGHYKNVDALGSLRHQEIWLDFTVDESGSGGAVATRDWTLSGARSVVLHLLTTANDGTAGDRLACINVNFDALS